MASVLLFKPSNLFYFHPSFIIFHFISCVSFLLPLFLNLHSCFLHLFPSFFCLFFLCFPFPSSWLIQLFHSYSLSFNPFLPFLPPNLTSFLSLPPSPADAPLGLINKRLFRLFIPSFLLPCLVIGVKLKCHPHADQTACAPFHRPSVCVCVYILYIYSVWVCVSPTVHLLEHQETSWVFTVTHTHTHAHTHTRTHTHTHTHTGVF